MSNVPKSPAPANVNTASDAGQGKPAQTHGDGARDAGARRDRPQQTQKPHDPRSGEAGGRKPAAQKPQPARQQGALEQLRQELARHNPPQGPQQGPQQKASPGPQQESKNTPRRPDQARGGDAQRPEKNHQTSRPGDARTQRAPLTADQPRSDAARHEQKPPRPRRVVEPNPIPPITFPEALPVSGRRDEIARAIAENQVVIVSGETGSGKTTQLPKICRTGGRGLGAGGSALIGDTHPRRIAAPARGRRIAEELGTPFGEVVGYKVRFTDNLSPGASVKLMTDGILLAETQTDPILAASDTTIIDEAPERSLNLDFLLGY